MPTQEEIAQQYELLAKHRRRLHYLLGQQANLGRGFTPPGVGIDIEDARTEIKRIKTILRGWGAEVDDLPDDGETIHKATVPQPVPPSTRSGWIKLITVIIIGAAIVIVALTNLTGNLFQRNAPIPTQVAAIPTVLSSSSGISVTNASTAAPTYTPIISATQFPGLSLSSGITPVPDKAILVAGASTEFWKDIQSAPALIFPVDGDFDVQVKVKATGRQAKQGVALGVEPDEKFDKFLRLTNQWC
jgi:hypothetical protein